METKKSLLLTTLFIIATCLSVLSADEVKKQIVTYKASTDQKVTVSINLHKYSSSNPLKYNFVWGSEPEFKPPESVIIDLQISHGDKNIPVPLSSYCDLTNVEKSWIEIEKEQFVLCINGGENATVYMARIYFDEFVRRRIVRHRCFPDNAWEETNYKINELDT